MMTPCILAEMSVKSDANGGENILPFLYVNVLESIQGCDD